MKNENSLLVTEDEAAELLGIGLSSLRRLRESGQLPFVPIPGRGRKARSIRYSRDHLKAWIDQHTEFGKTKPRVLVSGWKPDPSKAR